MITEIFEILDKELCEVTPEEEDKIMQAYFEISGVRCEVF